MLQLKEQSQGHLPLFGAGIIAIAVTNMAIISTIDTSIITTIITITTPNISAIIGGFGLFVAKTLGSVWFLPNRVGAESFGFGVLSP